jgi:hypothetical protein
MMNEVRRDYYKPVFIPGARNAPQEPKTEILGLEDIAQALGLAIPTVIKYIHQEGLPARKLGKRYYTTVTRLENWINERD